MKNKPNVAITGLQALGNPDPGLAISRCLHAEKEHFSKIVGLSYGLHNTANFAPFFNNVFLTPYPWDSQEAWLNRILDIDKKVHLDVLIPTLDTEIALISSISDGLLQMGIKTLLPPTDAVKTRGKNYLPTWCEKHDLQTPNTHVLIERSEVEKIAGKIGYPCYIKGAIAGAYLAQNVTEAYVYYDRIAYFWGLPVIAQQCIKGDDYVVCALADRQSQLIGSIALKKVSITTKGKCALGQIIHNETLEEMLKKIISTLKWVGPLEIEVVYDEFKNEYNLIEINARFPAWIYLASQANYNLPKFCVELALDQEVKSLGPCKSQLLVSKSKRDLFFQVSSYTQLAANGELLEGEILSEDI